MRQVRKLGGPGKFLKDTSEVREAIDVDRRRQGAQVGEPVENVSRPTLTVYSPGGKNTGVAVIVFPGGGYRDLAIDLEGTEVCDWLTSSGGMRFARALRLVRR